MLGKEYYDQLLLTQGRIFDTQYENIEKAAGRISQSLLNDGILHVFGIGHSFLTSKEAFFRKGGLVPVNPLYDADLIGPFGGVNKIIALESVQDFAKIIFEGYDVRKGEVLIQFSITGVSPLTVEINLEAQRRGLYTIAITNVNYGMHFDPKHSSGKRLCEVADLVIDNCGIVGDAMVDVPGSDGKFKAGAPATISALLIWYMIYMEIIEDYCEAGVEPPIILPTTIPGAEERNNRFFAKYKARLAKHF